MEAGEIQELNILDEYMIDSAAKQMSDLYSGKGYMGTNVSYTIERDSTNGEATVYFTIKEAAKIALKTIDFKGFRLSPKIKSCDEDKEKRFIFLVVGFWEV